MELRNLIQVDRCSRQVSRQVALRDIVYWTGIGMPPTITASRGRNEPKRCIASKENDEQEKVTWISKKKVSWDPSEGYKHAGTPKVLAFDK
jgi:hypothetical protein